MEHSQSRWLAAAVVALSLLVPWDRPGRLSSASAAAGPSEAVADDPCAGLATDKETHAVVPLPKPALGQVVVDPAFGTRIRRITDAKQQFGASVAKPVYSTIPAWNADESLLIVYVTGGGGGGRYALLDGRTYKFVRFLDLRPPDLEQYFWSASDPDAIFYVRNEKLDSGYFRALVKYRVSTGKLCVVRKFADCDGDTWQVTAGSDPMYSSWDNDLWGFACKNYSSGAVKSVWTYRISTGRESAHVLREEAPQPTASGRAALGARRSGEQGLADVLNPDSLLVSRTLMLSFAEHADQLVLANGTDVYAAVSYDGPIEATLATEETLSGKVDVVVGRAAGFKIYPPTSTHISGLAFRRPGWVAVSVVGDRGGAKLLAQELLIADLNTKGRVCRVAHHYSHATQKGTLAYWAEPHVVISPTATRLLFGSDWGGGDTVDSYVVELPAYGRHDAPPGK